MTVAARWPGTCPECGERWEAGDEISTDKFGGSWRHDVCPDTPAEPAKKNPLCPVCWLEHPEGACDR